MKFTHTLLLIAILAVAVQVIEAKKCKANTGSQLATSHKSGSKKHHHNKQQQQHKSSSSHKSSSKSTTNDATEKDATSSSSSSASSSSSTSSSSKVSVSGMTPNGKKAGVAGGQSVSMMGDNIGAWVDWGAAGGNDHTSSSAMYVPMLWGAGNDDANTGLASQPNSKRLSDFKKLPVGKYKYMIGFNEMDFHGTGSSGKMNVDDAANLWDELMAKHKNAGTKLISPSMALQKDETMMQPFLDKVSVKPDCIGVHIFQNSIDGVKGVLDHYKTKYASYNCIWITEFAYANYQNGAHNYGNVGQTDSLAKQAVELFENDDMVKAYFISDADNGSNGALTPNHNGKVLSSLGSTYKQAISSVSKRDVAAHGHAARHHRRAAAASRRSAAAGEQQQ